MITTGSCRHRGKEWITKKYSSKVFLEDGSKKKVKKELFYFRRLTTLLELLYGKKNMNTKYSLVSLPKYFDAFGEPQVVNSYDCGVFLCSYAKSILM